MVPSQSCYKKGHLTKVYPTDSEKEAIVDFLKNHEKLYDKNSEHFKDKPRKESYGRSQQPQQVTSPTIALGCSSVDQQVMDQFTQIRTMLSSFLR